MQGTRVLRNKLRFNQIRHYWPILLVFINYLIVMTSVRAFPLSNLLPGHDSAMFMYFGRGMNHGLVPYAQIYDHKGIVLFWIEQLANAIGFGGHFNTGVWVAELVFYGVYLTFMVLALLQLFPSLFASATAVFALTPLTVSAFQGGNLSEEFALPLIAVALYWFLREAKSQKSHPLGLIFIGLCGGLVFFMRANMIALWIVGCAFLIVRAFYFRDWSRLGRQALGIFIGGVIVVCCVIAYGLIFDNLREMFKLTFLVNIAYSDQANFQQRLQAVQFFWQYATAYFMTWFGAGWLLASLTTRKVWLVNTLLVCYGALNLLTVVLSGRPYLHYFTTMIPILTIMLLVGLQAVALMGQKWGQGWLEAAAGALVLVIVTTPIFKTGNIVQTVDQNIKTNIKAPINLRRHSATLAAAAYIQTHSTPNDRIYAHWMNASVYLYAERFASSRFFDLPSLDYSKQPALVREFSRDFDQHPPKFVLVRAGFAAQRQLNIHAVVQRQLRENYSMIRSFHGSDGNFDLYRHTP